MLTGVGRVALLIQGVCNLSALTREPGIVGQSIGGSIGPVAASGGHDSFPLKPSELSAYLSSDFAWRNEVFKLLVDQGSLSEAQNFLWCESTFRGVEVCTGDITHSHAIPITCHLRYCPKCARRDAARLVAAHAPQIDALVRESPHKNYRLRRIELTTSIGIFDHDAPERIQQAINAVNTVFDRFCGGKLPEKSQHRWSEQSSKHFTGEGYIFAMEAGENGYKVHFHILFYGRYIDKYLLSDVWRDLTGDSITYVQHVPKTEPGIREALKYVAKNKKTVTDSVTGEPVDTLPDPKVIARLAELLRGKRRVFMRGLFRGLESDITEPGADLGETICKQCGCAVELVSLPFWSEVLYYKYLSALKRQLDLKPGNKFSPLNEADIGPPDLSLVQQAAKTLNEVMQAWNQGVDRDKDRVKK